VAVTAAVALAWGLLLHGTHAELEPWMSAYQISTDVSGTQKTCVDCCPSRHTSLIHLWFVWEPQAFGEFWSDIDGKLHAGHVDVSHLPVIFPKVGRAISMDRTKRSASHWLTRICSHTAGACPGRWELHGSDQGHCRRGVVRVQPHERRPAGGRGRGAAAGRRLGAGRRWRGQPDLRLLHHG
jgi:hypothetical protein